jgi:hypothetical protein
MYNIYEDDKINNVNKLLEQSAKILSCDTECLKERKINNLKDNYDKAKLNILTAPEELEISAKNYYTYMGGDTAYYDYKEKKYDKEVNKKIKQYEDMFNKEYKYCNNLILQFDTIIKNSENTFLLYDNYINNNKNNKNSLENKYNTIFTNQRKTYYETKQIDIINNRHKILIILYFSLLFIYFIFLLLSKDKIINIFIITLLFSLYPFVIPSIINTIIKIYNMIGLV